VGKLLFPGIEMRRFTTSNNSIHYNIVRAKLLQKPKKAEKKKNK
jgi:hypothetical protein